MGYIPPWWKLESGIAPSSFALDHLDRLEVTNHGSANLCCDSPLVAHTTNLHPLNILPICHPSVTWDDPDPCLVPVQDQFGGNFFHLHCGDDISRNSSFNQSKSAVARLLFVVVAFLSTKFIRRSCEHAQCLLSSTYPPPSKLHQK